MTPDDKLKQHPHKLGGTFDVRARAYPLGNGQYRGKVRIRHSIQRGGHWYYETTFRSAHGLTGSSRQAMKDAKALKLKVIATLSAKR
ncbi:hypothetical protein ACOTD6_06930 [Achromobacter xylosoxidans]|jgi:hypothetical protein